MESQISWFQFILPLAAIWISFAIFKSIQIKKLIPKWKQEGAVIIDVRSKQEYASSHAPQTINIPLDELESRIGELDRSKLVLLCCASGARSALALQTLRKHKFTRLKNIGSFRVAL